MADLERDRGSQGLTPCKEGPPRMPPHPSVCHLRLILLAVECRLEAHSAWRSPAPETRPAHSSRGRRLVWAPAAAVGLPLSLLCTEMPGRITDKDTIGPLYVPSAQHRPWHTPGQAW